MVAADNLRIAAETAAAAAVLASAEGFVAADVLPLAEVVAPAGAVAAPAPLLGFLDRPATSPLILRPAGSAGSAMSSASNSGRASRVSLANRKRSFADLIGGDAPTLPAAATSAHPQARSEEEKLKEALQQVERTRAGESCVCKEVLPHIGYAHDVFPEKGMYLAMMTAKLLLFKVGGTCAARACKRAGPFPPSTPQGVLLAARAALVGHWLLYMLDSRI
jgi:hypothetical protein